MIKNLNKLLLNEFFIKDYLILKEENSKSSKTLLQNIKNLISFNKVKFNKNELNKFVKNKNN